MIRCLSELFLRLAFYSSFHRPVPLSVAGTPASCSVCIVAPSRLIIRPAAPLPSCFMRRLSSVNFRPVIARLWRSTLGCAPAEALQHRILIHRSRMDLRWREGSSRGTLWFNCLHRSSLAMGTTLWTTPTDIGVRCSVSFFK